MTVQDAGGNTVTGSTASITLAIGTDAGGGTLTCSASPKAALAGVDAFVGCKIDKAGTGYTLTAAAPGLTGATSSPFDIVAGPAAKLAFTSSSGDCSSGSIVGRQRRNLDVEGQHHRRRPGDPTPAGAPTPVSLANDQANSLLAPTSRQHYAAATPESSGIVLAESNEREHHVHGHRQLERDSPP